ncbi:hypothetical protein M422DRAFT_220784 [Sphaerobolus stellatus SS14]|nr:hypothetical protein M422DRAFT_220784 [Sphaerobolus stellatus SS14]
MQNESLTIPLVLNFLDQQSDLQYACSRASATKLVSWGLGGWTDGHAGETRPGVAMGCEDGSVYIFSIEDKKKEQNYSEVVSRTPTNPSLDPSRHTSRAPSPRPASPSSSRRSSLALPRSTPSASSHLSHFRAHPARSKVTSAVSKASAEAPKNYVDFDEEKEKLEGLVKNGPSPKVKSITDGLRSAYSVGSMGLGEPSRNVDKPLSSKLVNSTPNSSSTPASPRKSFSSPPSPSSSSNSSRNVLGVAQTEDPYPPLAFKFHVFSPSTINGDAVTSLQCTSAGVILVLQEKGVLSAISSRAGLCIDKLGLNSPPRLHPPPSSIHLTSTIHNKSVWRWQDIHIMEADECITLLVTASNQVPGLEDDSGPRSRVTVMQMQHQGVHSVPLEMDAVARDAPLFEKVAEWIMEGDPHDISLVKEDNSTVVQKIIYHNSSYPAGVTAQEIRIVPEAFAIAAPDSLQPSVDAISSASVHSGTSTPNPPSSNPLLNIPNPFKSKNAALSKINLDNTEPTASGRVVLGPTVLSGPIPELEDRKGLQMWSCQDGVLEGCTWNATELFVFRTRTEYHGSDIIASINHINLISVEKVTAHDILLIDSVQARLIRIPSSQGSYLDGQRLDIQSCQIPSSARTVPVAFVSPSLLLRSISEVTSEDLFSQHFSYSPLSQKLAAGKSASDMKPAWAYHREAKGISIHVSSILPIELESIVIGFDDGSLCRCSLATLLTSGWAAVEKKGSSFTAAVTSLHLVKNERTSENVLIGGSNDGAISVWDISSLHLLARWTVFIEPLISVIPLEEESVGRLRGCVFCVSSDGTIAVITIDGLEFLSLIPGAAARLTRICLGADNLLLIYSDGMARLWDIKTQEFWRSMTVKAAQELLNQGGWFEAGIGENKVDSEGKMLSSFQNSAPYDAASTLLLDFGALANLINPIPSAHSFRDPRVTDPISPANEALLQPERTLTIKKRPRRLRFLTALLGALHTFGLDSTVDQLCKDMLKIRPAKSSIGFSGPNGSVSVNRLTSPSDAWEISPDHTASRLLALVTLLRGLLAFDEEYEQHINQIVTFYVAALPDTVGHSWQPPSLSFLARYWLHSSSDVRLAARALFGSAAGRLSDEDTIRIVEYWQHKLPCLQPDAEKQSARSALALLVAGNIAAERFSVLSASTITDIAKSIALYLHDETCVHRGLAIDLCSRGFQIWQNHVDAMEVLRALFNLGTSADKERNVGPQARMAVLQIASGNTPLFMTTLSLDILHPKSLQQRKSILQLVAYLIRKKPLVLYPNLPRLVEAVVKSLDPSSTGDRDAVIDAATEILGQMVKIFPSVDFHMGTQRLCVGTSEGAVIMYDLKTATRLYVLEGHKRRLDACSFSPDGRRLVTVSLEESIVRVWKVGSSITSLFMPGAPPRQGHSGSDPYKTIPFIVGDEANMTTATVLECVGFEWPAERTARLKIRETVFTFNTS